MLDSNEAKTRNVEKNKTRLKTKSSWNKRTIKSCKYL